METLINNTKFAQRLQEIMDANELSATAFSEKLHVGRATISHLMAGRNKPSLDFVMTVVATFPEVELQWLLYGTTSSPKTTTPTPPNHTPFSADVPSKNTQESASKTSATPPSNTEQKTLKNITAFSSSKSPIKRVIIFLEDGTFESYEM
ncbi:helix-turn-helix transcriptional regulator [uncultured Dokdonia sp.]|uniref:helix-turn-helix domain-containing protein n=1 Tax=uncultured Dokdonia sp. TaxID=575653 RepID=UPI002604DB86|nr:helix-turn-helix transcriptional regulator [uncultured Dokdonia sp.]